MANKNAVLSRPTPDATIHRNAFDRSSLREYHYSLGQLVPVWFEPVIAGSHVRLNRKIFQRTADLKTAAFPQLDTHIQYYFVPFRQLWSLWPSFKLGIKDVESTGLYSHADEINVATQFGGNVNMPNRVPYTTLSDLESALLNAQSQQCLDIFGNPWVDSAKKLLNCLGYGYPNYGANDLEVNLWPLLAYHKIYFDHFRNTQYENNCARMYNLDYLWAQTQNMKVPANALLDTQATNGIPFTSLLNLHYVNYRNDYFTNIYPSLNYVSATINAGNAGIGGQLISSGIGLPSNIVDGNVGNVSVSITGSTGSSSIFTGSANNGNNSITAFNGGSSGDNASVGLFAYAGASNPLSHDHPISSSFNLNASQILNVQAIRAQFALDKLLRSSAYASQHVKDQYEARFGIKYPNDNSHSVFIGAYKNDITIGEVTSTSNTSAAGGDQLGAIGGKGVGYDDFGSALDFNASEDGIVMAVQYSTIRSMYRSLGIDSYLTKHLPEDYFQPEFMDMGLEPVYGYEFSQSLGSSTILGYRPRNQRYKLGIDKSYGLFADTSQDLSMFVNHTDMHRLPVVGQKGVNYAWFKMQPSDLDSIMAKLYDGTWSSDQIFGQTLFSCVVNQNMSVHGQPSL